jgi:hypothetical protein
MSAVVQILRNHFSAKPSQYFAAADALAKIAESEQVALWMIAHGYATGHGDTISDMLGELEWQAKERGENELRDALDNGFGRIDA